MKMRQAISLRVSDDAERLLDSSEPVVALNLMGLSLLSSKTFFAAHSVFWVDGVLGAVACRLAGLSIKRKPGRQLLLEVISVIHSRKIEGKVLVLGSSYELPKMTELLGFVPDQADLPWIRDAGDVSDLNLTGLGPEHIVFLAVGSPKQEWVAQAIYSQTGAKCFCVGGAVNMIEGRERIVPRWIQNAGFEWLYRLMSEPKRRMARLFSTLPSGLRNLRYASYIERLD